MKELVQSLGLLRLENPQEGSFSSLNNKPPQVSVTFDFNQQKIILKFDSEIVKQKEFDSSEQYLSYWWDMLFIEYQIDKNSKFVFSWREWASKQQFFEFSKYIKPISGKPGDPGYEPWTDLARWKHISNPQRGTIQTKNVYRTRYRRRQFPEFESVYFEVIGRPEKNWNTHNYTVGGSGW